MADDQPPNERATRSAGTRSVADARQAERDEPPKAKGSCAKAQSSKKQIVAIYQSVVGTGKPGGDNSAIVFTSDAARKALCDGVPQGSFQEPATDSPGWIYQVRGNAKGKNGAHEKAATALQLMGDHFGVDVLHDGIFKAPGPGVSEQDYIPVQGLTHYLRLNGLTQVEVEAFIHKYDQPDSVKEGEGKYKKKLPTKAEKHAKKAKAGVAAASKSGGFSAVPMREAAADDVRRRDLDVFLKGCQQPEPPSNELTLFAPGNCATGAPTFGAAPTRGAADTTHLTEDQQQRRARVQADYEDAVEAHERALLEHKTEDLKSKTKALKQRSWDLNDPTVLAAPAAPATPPQGRTNNREDTPTTPGIERSWSEKRAAALRERMMPEKRTVAQVVFLIDGKDLSYISSDRERAVVTLFATQLTRQQPLAQTIIGGIARSIETIGVDNAMLAIKFFVAPHSVKQWSATFGDGTSSTTAVFIDNSTRVRLLVLDNCQL